MIQVRAREPGIFGIRRVREGQEFTIERIEQLGKWMERLDTSSEDVAVDVQPERARKSQSRISI